MSRLVHGICTFRNKVDKVEEKYIVKVQEKLKHYEDLEEAGRLIELDDSLPARDELDRCTHRNCNKCDKYRRELAELKGE